MTRTQDRLNFRERSNAAEPLVMVFSLASLILGLVAALNLIPEDNVSEHALRWPAVAMTAGLLGCVAADLLVGGIKRGLAAVQYILLGLVYFLLIDVIQSLHSIDTLAWPVSEVFIALTIFAAACILGSAIQPRPLPKILENLTSHEYSPRILFRGLVIFFLLGMLNFAYYSDFSFSTMIGGLFQNRWGAPWARGELGGWNAFLDFMTYFGYALPTFTVMLAMRRGTWHHWTVGVGIIFSVIFLLFVAQGGGRRLPGVIVGAALFTWLGVHRDRLRPKHAAMTLAIVVGLLVVMEGMLDTRNRGFRNFSYKTDEIRQVRVDDNFLRLAQIIEIIPSAHPHVGFDWLFYILVRPVPRVLWPGKPVGPGFSLPEFLGARGVSFSMSAIGEWYMAFGWWGVAISGFLFGYVARWWTQLLERAKTPAGIGVYGLGLMALFLGLRSMIEVVLMTYPLLCILVVDRLFLNQSRAVQPIRRYDVLPHG